MASYSDRESQRRAYMEYALKADIAKLKGIF
jgi:hypothetical protein